ncbi:MAG: thioredoxin [Nanoarchaeota archaeon]|nr:thioredoxin [Nanoarchaeota archaeon]
MAIVHVKTTDEFKTQVSDSKKVVIVDFWAPWCGPCKMLGPVFEKLSEEEKDVKFVKINVDEANELAATHNIRSIPTLLIVKDGKVLKEAAGAMSKDQLKELLDSNK